MSNSHKITANGKVFVVFAPHAYQTMGRGIIVAYNYRGTRNGLGVEEYGPIRTASTLDSNPKSVGAQLVAQAQELFNADHEAMIAKVEADKATGVKYPSARLITRMGVK